MVNRVSDCVDCGLPCLKRACPHYQRVELICDECGDECDELYQYNGEQICADCLLEICEKVEVEDYE